MPNRRTSPKVLPLDLDRELDEMYSSPITRPNLAFLQVAGASPPFPATEDRLTRNEPGVDAPAPATPSPVEPSSAAPSSVAPSMDARSGVDSSFAERVGLQAANPHTPPEPGSSTFSSANATPRAGRPHVAVSMDTRSNPHSIMCTADPEVSIDSEDTATPSTTAPPCYLASSDVTSLVNVSMDDRPFIAPVSNGRISGEASGFSFDAASMDVRPAGKWKIHRCSTVQDGHSANEQLLYELLWRSARPTNADERIIRMSREDMAAQTRITIRTSRVYWIVR